MKMLAKKLFALCREFPWSKKWQTPCPLRQPDSSDGANRLLHFQFRKGNMKLRKLFAPIARATAAGSKPVAKMLMQKLFAPITGVISPDDRERFQERGRRRARHIFEKI
jgi:transposase